MEAKKILLDLTQDELKQFLLSKGQPAFRAKQLFGWLHKGVSFADMRNLPGTLRDARRNALIFPWSCMPPSPPRRMTPSSSSMPATMETSLKAC